MEPEANRFSVSPATAQAEGLTARPWGLLVTAMIIGIMSVSAGIGMPVAIASFEELYKGFGADLDGMTSIVLAVRWVWYLFAVTGVPIAVWIIYHSRVTRAELANMKVAAGTFLIVFLLVFTVTVPALYLPIFRLGSVV